MKLAIISDTHDNLETIKTFLGYAKKNNIEQIIHCGDVTDFDTIKYLANNFGKTIYLCDGNVDLDFLKNYKDETLKKVNKFKNFGEINLDGLNMAFTHYPEKAKKLAQNQKYDHVFYGHTHKPWLEKIDRTVLSNPGNLAGMFYPPSFAVLNTHTNELKLVVLDTVR